MTDSEKRVELQADAAVVRRVANPLGVGKATEMHYLLGDDRFTPWGQEIERALGRRVQEHATPVDGPVTVGELRRWIAEVSPAHGLREEVVDLVVIAWAALRQRAWFQHGAPLSTAPDPGSLSTAMELRTQDLPSPDTWEAARTVAGAMLGVTGAAYLTAPAVADFVGKVTDRARDLAQTAPDLVTALESTYRRLGIADGDRLRTARASATLVQQLRHLAGVRLVQALTAPELGGATPTAAGKSLASATTVAAAVTRFPWHRLDPLRQATDAEGPRATSAAAVVNAVRQALERDELVSPVAPALSACEEGVFAWLSAEAPAPGSASAAPSPEPAPGAQAGPDAGQDRMSESGPGPIEPGARSGRATRPRRGGSHTVLADLKAFLDRHPDDAVEVTWRVLP